MSEIDAQGSINISQMTHYEILKGLRFKDARKQMQVYEGLLPIINILPISEEIIQASATLFGNLRRGGIFFGDNDLLIGVTALVNNLTLVTNNSWHFSRIPGLQLENWTKTH